MASNDVLKESQDVFQFNQGLNPNSTINLDDFSNSFGPSNPPFRPIFVNLGNDFDFSTPMKPNINPTHGTISKCLAHATTKLLEALEFKGKNH